MEKQHVIRVQTDGSKAGLSKIQKEFNGLVRRIEKTEKELQLLRGSAERAEQRVREEYWPLVKKMTLLQVKLVRIYDRAYGQAALRSSEKKKLAFLIQELAFELISEQGVEELKPLYAKYDEKGFDARMAALATQSVANANRRAAQKLGSSPDDIDLDDPAAIQAFVDQQAREQEEALAEQLRRGAEERTERPKSEKQQARAARREEEARRITRSVRTLYMDLVKAFHPDREPDALEKARKTEIMQRVILAYEKRDLMALLRLQLEFNRIDQAHLEALADEQLLYYNRILKDQADELDAELFALQTRLGKLFGSAFGFIHSPVSLEYMLNTNLARVKQAVKMLKSDLELFSQADLLRLWLKEYQIPWSEAPGAFN